MGVHQLGGVFVPVNARFALEEVVYVTNKAGLRVLIVAAALGATVAAARKRMPTLEMLITVGPEPVADCLDWYGLNARTPVEHSIESSLKPEDMAEILFTSGTTANPKGAIHTHTPAVPYSSSLTVAFLLARADALHTFIPPFLSASAITFTSH